MATRRKKTVRPKKRPSWAQHKTTLKALGAGEWFERLVALQKRLRDPNGCPWDREQTHSTLRTYLIEEAYEVLDALETGEDSKFAEEMGDLLLQIVFHSQIATEEGRFTISDVIREIHEKMVRRHPHVFGTKRAKDAAEVLKNWEQIKARERREKSGKVEKPGSEDAGAASLLDGVPRGLPATLEGLQLTKKAARIGFDWHNAQGIFDKMREECAELQHVLDSNDERRIEEEVGDLLFAAVNLARFLRVDPEIALKNANAKFSRRFRAMEQLATQTGRPLEKVPREEMESFWEAAKRAEAEPTARAADGRS
jgi:tetrapyrrole methylase family protein / MazG family protein